MSTNERPQTWVFLGQVLLSSPFPPTQSSLYPSAPTAGQRGRGWAKPWEVLLRRMDVREPSRAGDRLSFPEKIKDLPVDQRFPHDQQGQGRLQGNSSGEYAHLKGK